MSLGDAECTLTYLFCSYASAFVGSFAFMAFALFAYQIGRPKERNASYYRSRLTYYASALALAGISQLFLGLYILLQFGGGPLLPAILVAMYTVSFPELSIAIGGFQLMMGFWGLLRRFNIHVTSKDDLIYQFCAFLMWMSMLSIQCLTQVAYTPEEMFASAAPSYACLYLGLCIMPPYLDYKMRTTPEELPEGYYGVETFGKDDSETEQEHALREYDEALARSGQPRGDEAMARSDKPVYDRASYNVDHADEAYQDNHTDEYQLDLDDDDLDEDSKQ